MHPLKSTSDEGIKASSNFLNKDISEIFRQDILNVYNQKVTQIRPIIGANGAGKTTLIKFQVKDYMEELAPGSNLFFFFDFKAISENVEEFWFIFIGKIIEQLFDVNNESYPIRDVMEKLPAAKRKNKLFKIFKNKKIIDNLIKLSSLDPNDQDTAYEFFYGDELESNMISNLFYGLIKLLIDLDYLVVIAFDEIQFLNEIDRSNVLLKLFLEKFIRYLMEQFARQKLYILVSCLENPNKMEWTELKSRSKNFGTIVDRKEIILGNLTAGEKDAIINQVVDKIGFDYKDRNTFISRVKSSILYYLPRDLLKCIANVIDSMGYIGYTDYDIRQIYEEDARNFIKTELLKRGFNHVEPEIKKVGGYDVDIVASAETKRTTHRERAFGEVSMMHRSGMKGKIEKFANWLLRMKNIEYKPDKGDFAFFICPPNSITSGAQDVLDANNIKLFEYTSSNIEMLKEQGLKGAECGSDASEEIQIDSTPDLMKKEQPQLTLIKDSKYTLTDIPGIGKAKVKLLNSANIFTVKDLLNCNVKLVAGQVKGVGVTSLNNWRQNARQIIG